MSIPLVRLTPEIIAALSGGEELDGYVNIFTCRCKSGKTTTHVEGCAGPVLQAALFAASIISAQDAFLAVMKSPNTTPMQAGEMVRVFKLRMRDERCDTVDELVRVAEGGA